MNNHHDSLKGRTEVLKHRVQTALLLTLHHTSLHLVPLSLLWACWSMKHLRPHTVCPLPCSKYDGCVWVWECVWTRHPWEPTSIAMTERAMLSDWPELWADGRQLLQIRPHWLRKSFDSQQHKPSPFSLFIYFFVCVSKCMSKQVFGDIRGAEHWTFKSERSEQNKHFISFYFRFRARRWCLSSRSFDGEYEITCLFMIHNNNAFYLLSTLH